MGVVIMPTKLYDVDFSLWAVAQAEHLRNEEYAELDLNNLIEEIEDMAGRHRDELHNRFVRIMTHLLKIECEPDSRAVRGWKEEIQTYRGDLLHMLKRNPSLRASASDYVAEAYQTARRVAAAGSDCSIEDFAEVCPWTAEQVLDLNWLP